ncbi:MAG TPA: hypothetical protein EYP14_05150, partial [Planctomycetaceae bacterium]|nr:hypothetical protein [Planctomycetaceae bacterium]
PEPLHDRSATHVPQIDDLAELEKTTIQRVLNECGWNIRQAARRLGISRTTLYSKVRKHAIELPEQRRKKTSQ